MSVFRIAVAGLVTGLLVFLAVVRRSEVMSIVIALLHNPEFWVAVGLAVVVAIFLRLKVPGIIGRMLDDRANLISRELAEARQLREEAASLLAGYARKAAQAESEAAAILAEAKAEAERFAKETRAQLRAQIDRRALMAKEKIEQAEAAAVAEIRGLAADKAAAAAERLIAARLDQGRSDALVRDSLRDLPDKLS